ncbi:hypothetical protein MRX96_037615 [Rhipicephalus microplus]
MTPTNWLFQEFYKGKSVLITGVTGFLGKILLEKLLRSCPGINQIFLLIRPRKGCKSKERLSSLLKSECFEHVHREHAEALEKLVAVDGDLTEPGLGLQPADYELLTREVSVVFHSAATIKFNETLRQAVEMNMEGTRKVLKLCHEMKKLQAVVHVSTAYCNCDCKKLGRTNISIAHTSSRYHLLYKVDGRRHAGCAYPSAITCKAQHLPIVRPSIVAASWKEPFPGWVDALNGSTSLLASCASGVMTTIVTDVKGIADIVPVDIVANLLIVVACQTAAKRARQRELEAAKEKHWETVEAQPPAVYNCVTGSLNKLVVGDVKRYLAKFLPQYPFQETLSCPRVDMTTSRLYQSVMVFFRNYLPALAVDLLSRCTGRRPRMVRFLEQSKSAMEAVRFFTTQTWEFSSNNMLLLHSRLSPFDRQTFDIDIRKINWESYWENYLLGVRRYLFKQDPSTIPESRKRLKRQHAVHVALKTLLLLGFLRVLLGRSKVVRQLLQLAMGLLTQLLSILRFSSS